MNDYQTDYPADSVQQALDNNSAIVCPYCNGSGCPNCQNTGQLEVSPEELAQLQALMQMPIEGSPSNIPLSISQATALKQKIKSDTIPGSRITIREIKTKTAGLLAFLFIFLLFAGAWFSKRFFTSYGPYFASLASFIVLVAAYYLSKTKYMRYSEPQDFLSLVQKLRLQKSSPFK